MQISSTLSLIKQLVRRDLSLRYRSTFLGFFWSFVQPLALITLFYVVFEKILPVRGAMSGIPQDLNYGLFLAVGITAWSFISGAITQGAYSYLVQTHLINRARFWRPALPLGGVLSHWIHYCFAQVILVSILIVCGVTQLSLSLLWLFPLSLAEFFLVLGVVWILAGLQVYARDTIQFLELAMMALFYISPVIYPASLATGILQPQGLEFLYWMNPMTPLLTARQCLLLEGFQDSVTVPSPGIVVLIGMILVSVVIPLGLLSLYMNHKIDRGIVDRL